MRNQLTCFALNGTNLNIWIKFKINDSVAPPNGLFVEAFMSGITLKSKYESTIFYLWHTQLTLFCNGLQLLSHHQA